MTDASGPPASESSGAQEKAQEVAGQAQEKAGEATERAQSMVREQVDQRSAQAGERVAATADDLRSVGEELRKQGKEGPAKFADKAAERSEQLGSYLRESDSDRLLSDVEELGRRQPLAVLAGGLVVGMAAARFLKASSRDRYQRRIGSEGATRELTPAAPSPPPPIPTEPVGSGRIQKGPPTGTVVGG
jgi:uncharacterized protein YjbJ (UPF0337 family)